MKKYNVLSSAICLLLLTSSAFAQPKIETSKKALYISAEGSTYIYYHRTRKAEFITMLSDETVPATGSAITGLDKKNIPQHITIMLIYNGTLIKEEYKKSDPENSELYEKMELRVKNFVEKNRVAKIIARYKKRKR